MSLTIRVLVDGVELADTAADYEDGTTTALDGLVVRWGRASRIDQPRASTATLSIALPDGIGAHEAMDRVYPGARIEVETRTIPTATYTRILMRSALSVVATSTPWEILDSPMLPVEPGTNPTAWDAIPVADEATTYTLSVDVQDMTAGTVLHLHPVYYRGPWALIRSIADPIATATTTGTLTGTLTPPADHWGEWVGLAVSADPDGTTWAAASGTWADQTRTYAETVGITVTNATITRTGSDARAVTVFAGRITDAPVSYETAQHRPLMQVTAQDVAADLGNRRISDQPWAAEPARQRLTHIMRLIPDVKSAVFELDPHAILIAPRDVDGTSAAQLLADLAQTLGMVLWPSTHRGIGDYLRFEDLTKRTALYTLTVPASGPVTIEARRDGAIRIPASQILRDGLTVERDTTDLATSVAVTWKEIGEDDTGAPTLTDRRETLTDPTLTATLGYRNLSVSTELTTAADAQTLATQLLARSAPGGWGIPAAIWESQDAVEADVLAALDASTRPGLPLLLDGVDDWVPGSPLVPVYLDGGTYTYRRGTWSLAMNLTRAAQAGASVQWAQIPAAVTFDRMTGISWADLASVQMK